MGEWVSAWARGYGCRCEYGYPILYSPSHPHPRGSPGSISFEANEVGWSIEKTQIGIVLKESLWVVEKGNLRNCTKCNESYFIFSSKKKDEYWLLLSWFCRTLITSDVQLCTIWDAKPVKVAYTRCLFSYVSRCMFIFLFSPDDYNSNFFLRTRLME